MTYPGFQGASMRALRVFEAGSSGSLKPPHSLHARESLRSARAPRPSLSLVEGRFEAIYTTATFTANANTMPTQDIAWDEDRGGPRDPLNLISFPDGGQFHQSTKKILEWKPCGPHDQGRVVLPSVHVERLFRKAPVNDPKKLNPLKVMTRCLDIQGYMADALDLLVDEGLLTEIDEEGDEQDRVFETIDDLTEKADKLVRELIDHATLAVDDSSFEWLEDFHDRAGTDDSKIKWLSTITLAQMTEDLGNLEAYVDLALMLGPRSTEAVRVDHSSQFFGMIGEGEGGQLSAAMRKLYFPEGNSPSPAFMAGRLATFMTETRWPRVLNKEYANTEEYAYDLPRRAAWKKAARQEWPMLVQHKLGFIVKRRLPTVNTLFKDYVADSMCLVQEVEVVADMLLYGSDTHKLPLRDLQKIEDMLHLHYGDMIRSEAEEGKASSEMVPKLLDKLKAAQKEEKGATGKSDEDEVRGPKPGQINRALAEKAYTKLEVKHMTPLQDDTYTNDQKLEMIKECLTSGSVLPHAVIFAPKGARMSVYIGAPGADLLALLYGERHMLPMYLGQTLVYDPDEGEVPRDLRTFRLGPDDTAKLCNFEWGDVDFLNGILLKIRGEEAGTEFLKYSTKTLYHHADMLTNLQELYGRLFEGLGYARDVPKAEGMSYRGFLAGLKRIHTFAIGLSTDEQKGAFAMIDDYAARAMKAAADNAKRIILGPSPADRKLGPWLRADEAVVIELTETLATIKDTATYRRRMGSIFGSKAKAAALPGFGLAGGAGGGGGGGGGAGGGANGGRKAKAGGGTSGGGGGTNGGGGSGGGKATGKGKSPGGKANTGSNGGANQGGKPKVGSAVEAKRIFPYEDGTFSIGKRCLPTNGPSGAEKLR